MCIRDRGGRDSLNRGAEFALALTLPAAVALMVIAGPLCSVLYQRGAFGPDDAAATALALAAYGAGLPAFVLHKVLQPLFYAREDSRSPFLYALWSMGVNAALALGLMPLIGFSAAAWATTFAGWVMVAQLWRGSRSMGQEARLDTRFLSRLPRILLASALMGAGLWLGAWALEPALNTHLWRYAALAALVIGGSALYFAAGFALGAFRLSDFARLRRKG